MATPTFNGEDLFSSQDGSTGGNLLPLEFQAVRQRVHINGANGDVYIGHGYPDRQWRFTGLMAATLSNLMGYLSQIEGYIQASADDTSIYYPMTDTNGVSYPHAQIATLHVLDGPRYCDGGYYVAHIQVDGIIKGMGTGTIG